MLVSRGWLRVLLIAATLVVALPVHLAVPAAPARAHAELVSSEPADGAILAVPPERVSFKFGEDLLAQGNAITAFAVAADGRAGDRVALPDAVVAGSTVSVAWPQSTPAGKYRANYRVVSADGHPISGSISFTIAGESLDPSAASPAAGATRDPGTGASAPAASPTVSYLSPTSQKEPARAGVLIWVLGVGVVGLGLAGGALWFTRRSRGL